MNGGAGRKGNLWKGWTTTTSTTGTRPLWVHEALGLRLTERPVRVDEQDRLVVQPEILFQLIVNHRRDDKRRELVHDHAEEFVRAMGLKPEACNNGETCGGKARIEIYERAMKEAEALVVARQPALARPGCPSE